LNHAIPLDLETICLKAMAKDPTRRYRSSQDLAVDLRRYLDGEPIIARRAGMPERCWRWVRKHPAVATAGVLAILAVASFGIAQKLARENQALLGLQTVSLATEPAGARIVFVPVNPTTDILVPSAIVRARGRSPIIEDLRPGDYLVVAALDDGRFHEVYRHVPKDSTELPGGNEHYRWEITKDHHYVTLPKIKIPPADITKSMTWFSYPTAPSETPRDGQLGFFMDRYEFTVKDYHNSKADGSLPKDRRWRPMPDDRAVTVSYDDAMSLAEGVGKRLPTDEEYNDAILHVRFADKSDSNQAINPHPTDFEPVGTSSQDRTDTDPPVFDLLSNVAEWTSSSGRQYIPENEGRIVTFGFPMEYQTVRGGDLTVIQGDPTIDAKHRDPMQRTQISRYAVEPGLGFRCVRSAKPRFIDE
jgi:serine/threonine-protein kinase